MYKGPGLEDGEHVLMVPFRGWPESSVVEAALLATAIKVKPVYSGRIDPKGEDYKSYDLHATGLPHIVHHLPALSIALVQSLNLIPTLRPVQDPTEPSAYSQRSPCSN